MNTDGSRRASLRPRFRQPLGLPDEVFEQRIEEMSRRAMRNKAFVKQAVHLNGLTLEEAANLIDMAGDSIFGSPLPGDELISRD